MADAGKAGLVWLRQADGMEAGIEGDVQGGLMPRGARS